jgi:hypothetical protein
MVQVQVKLHLITVVADVILAFFLKLLLESFEFDELQKLSKGVRIAFTVGVASSEGLAEIADLACD